MEAPVETAVARISAGSTLSHVMDDAISPWELYDLSGAVNPDTLSTMIDHFRRFRATRKKNIEVADQQGLRRSWCAFIRRWNQILELEKVSPAGWLTARRYSWITRSWHCARRSAITSGMLSGSVSLT
ncbi:hypothetical protein PPTG_21860 [Phytophthora nicotianae INRA-310]|uniref:Uncharacterized protein n=1 Tax=Phytophthora nicotianae (strain INRA-310) TaxID=761204 RepID=W2QSA2_PHYN3|nr:hypothetical protein PPTG_21860 [Phytophthora nicotianae INRA-310]ETN16082.1 hypothetical protein PPTG_21860 [Phytophthora nicotianae INRA-310]